MFSSFITDFKKLIFSVIYFAFIISIFAQDQNSVDEIGRKQGFWSKKYENGKLRFEGNFIDNRPTGTFKYWHENGNLKAEMEYFNDGLQCKVALYNADGKHVADGFYFEKVKDSLWRYFDDETGTLVSEEFYHKDIPNGKWTIFYSDGKTPSEIINYEKGKKEGEQFNYFENGNLKQKWSCKKSVVDGEIVYYHPNGKVRGTGQYENNEQVGVWTFFDENGMITVKDYYEKGKLIKTEDFEKKE